ncbi:trans-1,2-dihydrobenzene-1,2-diol dehydrogenase-like [Argiope bruennichi]|uniref:Trans-1,2-dihydrobenzene-1,2-diol dehydrogenase n=1 Tax=Argiope bruennichi TaxID=94029 RepID=A0A8T0E6G9_ARGBR|nr:trans-1,2-dihydrobenzene-1,2-diol dehydrogenase-like [Argiope bruennichi]XP_055935185.1 trans-1,2-dihydrobenzene-1,2-diol dehydrogenase-like [Argiope bruennichi]KAF8766930.1 Trans-1 like protein [Argiope bruennichi]
MATKWGIASAGKISNDFVAAVKGMCGSEHEFLAVAARNLSSAKSFASTHNIPKAYGSYEELAEDQEIEVVYIGSVNSQHFRLAKLMLENGKHVLVEKPMTLNLKQTKALGEIARKNKLFLMEALWSRFLPSYRYLMDIVNNGSIGDIVHVDANFGISMLDRERIVTRALGGGTILDLGIYPLNAVSMIYKNEKPEKIAAVGHLNEDGVDISMTCSLRYSKNRTATVTTNGMAQLPNSIVIIGTKGQIKVPYALYVATKIETKDGVVEFPLPKSTAYFNYPNCTGLAYEVIEVRKYIQNGLLESPIMPLKDSELLAEIMDGIRHQVGVVYPEEDDK